MRIAFFWIVAIVGIATAASEAPPRSLLLVTLDTTRADRLGCYGDRSAATANLDRLAREGVRFERVVSPAPLTLPSHATLLTGLVPRRHGARVNAPSRLGPDVDTLAGLLAARGFHTAAFVSSVVLDRITGLDRGFAIYDDTVRVGPREAFDHQERAASQAVDAVLARLPALEEPFFLWVHFFDPHLPYVPPEPYRTRFAADPYAGEIAFMDEQVGRLLAAVRRKSRGVVVAVAGDHGESLGEHGEAAHGVFVYEATQRVPLLLAGPGIPRGLVVRDRVGLVDLAPTLLELAGVAPPADLDGHSLLPLVRGEKAAPRAYELESLFGALTYGWTPLRGLVEGNDKLVLGIARELYRLEADPGERRDLSAADPRRARRLEARLRALVADDVLPALETDPELAEHRRRLESLGYLAGGASSDADPIDPRDGIRWLADLEAGRKAYQTGRPEAGIEPLQRLLARNSSNVAALLALGRCFLGAGDAARAVEIDRRALALRSDDDLVHFNLANSLAALAAAEPARAIEARAHYERALALNPRHADAYLNYVALLERSGSPAVVGGLLDRARSAGVRDPEIEIRTAAFELKAGRLESAETALRRALDLDPGSERARAALAAILERKRAPNRPIQPEKRAESDFP